MGGDENRLFAPDPNPAELGFTCKGCRNYYREQFVPWSKASCGRCRLKASIRIKAKDPACVLFEEKGFNP